MNQHDLTYLSAVQHVLQNGQQVSDRTGVGTLSTFGIRQEYDISSSFPALTTKKLAWNPVVSELLWFIEGSGNERRLAEILYGEHNTITDKGARKPTIWTANAEADYWKPKAQYDGDLGRVYGVQWRSWRTGQHVPTLDKDGHTWHLERTVDQLQNLVDGLKKDPHSRRHILSAWNVGELDQMALPPCHMFAQFYVRDNTWLDCQFYQRSNDLFLGCPFNIASYALLTYMVGQVTGYRPGRLVHISGDAHIYQNHIEQVTEQLSRTPYPAPRVELNPDIKDITQFTMADIKLVGYESHPAIKAPMAV